jgi:hypothetical protein
MDLKPIFSLRLAGYLMTKGIPPNGLTRDLKTGFFVWLFENTETVNKLINEYGGVKHDAKQVRKI